MTNPVKSGLWDVANLFFSTTLWQKVLVQGSVPKNLFSTSAVRKVAREALSTCIGAYERVVSDLHRPPISRVRLTIVINFQSEGNFKTEGSLPWRSVDIFRYPIKGSRR